MNADARLLLREIEALTRELVRAGDSLELTPTQRVALAAIADHGPMRLHALAERVGTTDATASRTVDAFVHAGLVERVADENDRRAVRIGITSAGRKLVDRRRTEAARVLERGLVGVPARERERLVELLGRLNDGLRAP
jgi:DNA-binding MarR family transcriptional regulator